MYVTLFPCNICAKLIIQSGIKEVIFLRNTRYRKTKYKASKLMLDEAKVVYK